MFDYEKAWETRVLPNVLSIPQNIRELFIRVAEEAEELSQTPDLLMPWPELSSLKTSFEKIPAEELSWAAAIFHAFGHWASKDWSYASRWGNGAYWKFSIYARMSLDERLELPRKFEGLFCQAEIVGAIDGELRVQVSDRNGWSNFDVGFATHGTLLRVLAAVRALESQNVGFDGWCKAMEAVRQLSLARNERYRIISDLSEFGA